jgi:ABC-type phosphate transport system permease subunit
MACAVCVVAVMLVWFLLGETQNATKLQAVRKFVLETIWEPLGNTYATISCPPQQRDQRQELLYTWSAP